MNKDQHSIANTGFLQELFLAPEDVSRFLGSLSKLAHHLEEPPIITGSIATGFHLLKSGRQPKKRHLNDIDTVAVKGLSTICPSLSRDFLINHFHPYRERGKVLLQLVDEAAEEAKLKIAANSNLLQATRYCRDIDFVCEWCRESELFPIASRSKIYEILGYV